MGKRHSSSGLSHSKMACAHVYAWRAYKKQSSCGRRASQTSGRTPPSDAASIKQSSIEQQPAGMKWRGAGAKWMTGGEWRELQNAAREERMMKDVMSSTRASVAYIKRSDLVVYIIILSSMCINISISIIVNLWHGCSSFASISLSQTAQ